MSREPCCFAIKKLPTHKITQKEYYNNVLTTANAEYIIKVVGAKPFEKRLASKGLTK